MEKKNFEIQIGNLIRVKITSEVNFIYYLSAHRILFLADVFVIIQISSDVNENGDNISTLFLIH